MWSFISKGIYLTGQYIAIAINLPSANYHSAFQDQWLILLQYMCIRRVYRNKIANIQWSKNFYKDVSLFSNYLKRISLINF